jgi:hypothetical protein
LSAAASLPHGVYDVELVALDGGRSRLWGFADGIDDLQKVALRERKASLKRIV